MGLIGWIKKETSRQRRQSAPPPIAIGLVSPNKHRDEAYMKAINKFSEWRNEKARFERLSETNNASAITQMAAADKTVAGNDFSIISDMVINDDERRRLIDFQLDRKMKHKAVFNKNHRMSFPIMNENRQNPIEKPPRRTQKTSQVHPVNTIDEREEFENNHCGKMDEDFSITVTSPPSKFYRNNSEPYIEDNQLAPEIKRTSAPKRQSLMGRNMLSRSKSAGKGKAPQPPGPPSMSGSENSTNFYSGNFKHYDVCTSSVYAEFPKATNAHKAVVRKQQQEKINSVGESSSSGSLSSDQEKNAKKMRRLSPPYQTVINKHGDEVEYALPYSERGSLPPLPKTPAPENAKLPSALFEQYINEKFDFLDASLSFFNAQHEQLGMNQEVVDQAFEPIAASFSDIRGKNLQVTDLDKSIDVNLFPASTKFSDALKELDQLSEWTKKLQNCDNKSPVVEYQAIQKNIKLFNPQDIKYKSGALRNSFSTPLELSTGYFRTMPVTLRSTMPNHYGINSFADVACKHEFEIMTQMRHQSISILMGICYDNDLRVMSLVMEPFDYTLNHYLHQMDQSFSIQQTITIVKQIACATQYLHECGFVHSNISSHAVLISESPFAVKLSSFELTTEILPGESFDNIFHPDSIDDGDKNMVLGVPADSIVAEKYYKLSKQHFFNRTSLPNSMPNDDENESRLPYSLGFRRMFAMHYYQPPELLILSSDWSYKYVLPTTRSDTFSLCLLLWEMLNQCVPFVVYNHDELILAYRKNDAWLPLLNKSSIAFADVFHSCLRINPDERLSDVSNFVAMLDEVYQAGDGKKATPESMKTFTNQHKTLEEKKNFKNTKLNEKNPEKIYFTRANEDPQKRGQNAITMENLRALGQKDSSKVSESVLSSEIEANVAHFAEPPGIFLDNGALDRIRKSVEDQRKGAPKKPIRKADDQHDSHDNNASRRSFADSTMYQSFFGLNQNKLHTPKIDKDVIYGRTSTLKKRLKGPEIQLTKKTAKGLFDSQLIDDAFGKMNNELSKITQDYNKNDFMNEIVQELSNRQQQNKDEIRLNSFLNCGITNNVHDQSRSFEELPKTNPDVPKIRRSGSDNVHSYGNFNREFPRTPIATKNKIRRNAWLSDEKRSSGARISDASEKFDFTNNSPNDVSKENRKQYNVSIKIHHNDLETTPKQKSSNMTPNDSLINIKMYASDEKKSPLVKVNNIDLNASRNADLNKKYYPMMPELLSDVIQNRRDRSGFLQVTNCEDVQKSQMEVGDVQNNREEGADLEEDKIIAIRPSVRDAIKLFESSNQKKESAEPQRTRRSNDVFSTPTGSSRFAHEETQTEMFFTPKPDFQNFENDDVGECLMHASESIQKLNEMIQFNQPPNVPMIVNKRLESVVSQTPNKITTKVTVNVKSISGRSSDIGHLKQIQEQTRHSISNSAELVKRIQMHFKSKALKTAQKNDSISASCSSLVPRSSELGKPGKCSKYFCRNCGFTMLPVDLMRKIQGSGRLSIASSIAEGLQTMNNEDGAQAMTPMKKFFPIHETRSVEDIYIDDDFCQGISQNLAANMELLSGQDYDNIDYELVLAEILHTQEHLFGSTLTDGGKMQLEVCEHEQDDDEVFEDDKGDQVLPTCDDENLHNDEPKVEGEKQ